MKSDATVLVRRMADADAVVVDCQRALAVPKDKMDFDPFRPPMGDGVVHGFLGDPIEMGPPVCTQLRGTRLAMEHARDLEQGPGV